MTFKAKQKGSDFERKAVELLNDGIKGSNFKRVPGSGAMGTTLGEPLLSSDVKGSVDHFPMNFRIECKTGYSNKKGGEARSISILKLWIDKVIEEAKGSFSFPFLIAHFDGARSGVKNIVIMDVDEFSKLINMYTDLKKELDLVYASRK